MVANNSAFLACEFNDRAYMSEVLLSGVQMKLVQNLLPISSLFHRKGKANERLIVPNVALIHSCFLLYMVIVGV